jgi:hypothetical protein
LAETRTAEKPSVPAPVQQQETGQLVRVRL